ncbi:hypothetical protein ACFWGP_06920 [Agromyces sp. NPDC127015]|uniref:hypothetical protein n=1 Tax=Agromyces sp. NPDC127015 TaxID=3347108 RepID=UPI003662ED64
MTPDILDDLLDRAAPETRVVPSSEFSAMINDARRAQPRSRRMPMVLTGGAIVALIAGGAGVAAATDLYSWAPWAQDPLGAVPFTMANGFECELRFSDYTGGADPGFVSQVNQVLKDWYRSTDVIAEVSPSVPSHREQVEQAFPELYPGETRDTLPPEEVEHRAWAREWQAWDLAIGAAEWDQLGRNGIQPGDPRFEGSERSGQIQCLDSDGQPYLPGAGS